MDISQKKNLRNYFLNQRNHIYKQTDFNVQSATKKASQNITAYLGKMSSIWGSYRPINTEFDPSMIESDHKHLTWAYPKIKEDILEFRCFLDSQRVWQKNYLGIEEPSDASSEVISMEKMQGILCPALAVDLRGNRLGYGKGYYDQVLSGFRGKKIALVFSVQVSQQIFPITEKDVPMDYILTEVDFFDCQP